MLRPQPTRHDMPNRRQNIRAHRYAWFGRSASSHEGQPEVPQARSGAAQHAGVAEGYWHQRRRRASLVFGRLTKQFSGFSRVNFNTEELKN